MKTNIKKVKSQNSLVLFIYLFAFVLMTWSFQARAEGTKSVINNPEVIISTSLGDISVKLNAEKAPISTENFLKYVEKKHYDGTTFHRVIKTFMIQGGGHLPDMTEKETIAPIKNEAKNGLTNARGTIAMARTNEIDSATAQFFINVVDNKRLDHVDNNRYGYAVFGEVTKGMDVVDKIKDVATTTKGEFSDVPEKTVMIKSVRLVGAKPENKPAKKSKKGKN
jgi:cyclophilin family peptidyl-prolyl cis-trans isomerase